MVGRLLGEIGVVLLDEPDVIEHEELVVCLFSVIQPILDQTRSGSISIAF